MDMFIFVALASNMIKSANLIRNLLENFNFFSLTSDEAIERLEWIKQLEDPTTCSPLKKCESIV